MGAVTEESLNKLPLEKHVRETFKHVEFELSVVKMLVIYYQNV